ncbi:MAG: nucleoside deaminase [Candidatus Marinimicrobia bacterium]|nr:nucleoside deaminase [Candidatus Neomarinimicrobiota bacterium]
MKIAIDTAFDNIKNDGGPFGAVIVKDGKIVGRGGNRVTASNDPTAHAEITAIRDAGKNLHTFDLKGCVIYSSCEPCPMCLAAIYWARIDAVHYGSQRQDAAKAGFDDDFIYKELALDPDDRQVSTHSVDRDKALDIFTKWTEKTDKIAY